MFFIRMKVLFCLFWVASLVEFLSAWWTPRRPRSSRPLPRPRQSLRCPPLQWARRSAWEILALLLRSQHAAPLLTAYGQRLCVPVSHRSFSNFLTFNIEKVLYSCLDRSDKPHINKQWVCFHW